MVVMLPPPDSALAAHINYRGLPTPQQPDTPPKPQIRPRAADQPKPAMSGVLEPGLAGRGQRPGQRLIELPRLHPDRPPGPRVRVGQSVAVKVGKGTSGGQLDCR